MSIGGGNIAARVSAKYPCREEQITQLTALLSPRSPRPSNVVVHGAEAAGKSSVTTEIAAASSETATVIVKCEECITVRHLLERTIASCVDAAAALASHELDRRKFARCENVAALHAHLQDLSAWLGPFILVLDGIDRLLEASPGLLPALTRVADNVQDLTLIYVISLPSARAFHYPGLPSVYFPAYVRSEILQIVSRDPIPIHPTSQPRSGSEPTEQLEDDLSLWTRFCAAVWDSLAMTSCRDLVSFRALAEKLWPLFTVPVLANEVSCRDFSRLMVANRALFQSDDCLTDRIQIQDSEARQQRDTQHISPVAKYFLCAAYLASYNPARQDQLYFMELSEKRKKRKGGGARRGRPPTHRKIPRKALPPSPFTFQRLQAIFSAIYPTPVDQSQTTDIMTTIASLTSARLLLRSGGGGAQGDPLDERAKWRVNVGWDHVVSLGRSVGFEIQDWSAE